MFCTLMKESTSTANADGYFLTYIMITESAARWEAEAHAGNTRYEIT